MLQHLDVLGWKWGDIVIQLVTYFAQSMRGHNAIWMITDRLMHNFFLRISMDFFKE